MGNEKLLDIKNLSVTYKTEDGIVYAVNDLNMRSDIRRRSDL